MTDYDSDIVLWSEHQSSLLRRRACGEAVNEDELDWTNITQEIASVGSEQRHAVESLLLAALVQMLKADAWPLSRDAPNWRADAVMLRAQATNRFAPSMQQRINLARIYRQARRAMPDTIDDQPPLPTPEMCPVTLDELLSDD